MATHSKLQQGGQLLTTRTVKLQLYQSRVGFGSAAATTGAAATTESSTQCLAPRWLRP